MGRPLLALGILACALVLVLGGIPAIAAHTYGPPSSRLTAVERIEYSARVLWDDGLLTRPLDPTRAVQVFEVQIGESVDAVCRRLQAAGIVGDASMLRDYLIYTGQDTSVQAGTYHVSAGMSIIDVARGLQDATPTQVSFVVLPGWRLEEIAASLPTSGLSITPEEFVAAAAAPYAAAGYLEGAATTEGFLYPDSYILARGMTVKELIDLLVRNFLLHLTVDLEEGYARQGLTVYQAVTLASIVQREAVKPDEAPIIASVYLNRLKMGMRLEADPTVQYAAGYNAVQGSWWTNPLSVEDLRRPSPYNTYLNEGLPPAPIDNPALDALRAAASPAETPYYYFTARCDGTGYHSFAQTFDEHLRNLCP
jgi:UPF0755 protein